MKPHKFKNTVVFISGFRKDSSSWNYDSKNKPLLIEETLSKVANTVLIEFTDDDYKLPVSQVSQKIHERLQEFSSTNIVLVAHSIGSFYALKLTKIDPHLFHKVLLIDPTIKTPKYLQYLKFFPGDPVKEQQVINFDDLPDVNNLSTKTIIRIHFDYNEDMLSDIPYYHKLTNKNAKSRLIMHYEIGHMIHWNTPGVIIDSIKEFIKS